MKKPKKTTDSILKDIFDPIHQAEEASAHPLADLTVSASPNDAEALKNSILSSVPVNRVEPFIEEKPEEIVAALPVIEELAAPVVETAASVEEIVVPAEEQVLPVREVPLLVAMTPIPEEKIVPVTKEISSIVSASSSGTKVLNIAAVIAGILALVAALLILGVIWRGQTTKPAVKSAAPAIPAQAPLAPHPVLVKIDQIGHEGIRFKNYSVKGNKFMLRGFVTDQTAITRFVKTLNNSSYFRNASLTSIQAAGSGAGQKIYEFQLYADIRS